MALIIDFLDALRDAEIVNSRGLERVQGEIGVKASRLVSIRICEVPSKGRASGSKTLASSAVGNLRRKRTAIQER